MNQTNDYGVMAEPTDMEVKLYRVSQLQTIEQKPAADRYVELYRNLQAHRAKELKPINKQKLGVMEFIGDILTGLNSF